MGWDEKKRQETGLASVRKCAERLKRQVTLPFHSTHRWARCVMTLPATAKIDPSFLAKAISPCQASPSPPRASCLPPSTSIPPSFQVPSTRPENGHGSFCHIKFQSSLFTLDFLDSFLFAKYHHDWLFALPGTNFIDYRFATPNRVSQPSHLRDSTTATTKNPHPTTNPLPLHPLTLPHHFTSTQSPTLVPLLLSSCPRNHRTEPDSRNTSTAVFL